MAVEVAAEVVTKHLGYKDGLKDLQRQVVAGLVGGRDVYGVLPTGYGKSLCYGCLPWTFDKIGNSPEPSIVCVLTPRTAIIEDQLHTRSYRRVNQLEKMVRITKRASSVLESI